MECKKCGNKMTMFDGAMIHEPKWCCPNCDYEEEVEEDRCLIDGCQELIACSFCGGCEEHHRNNLEDGKCEVQKIMEEEEDLSICLECKEKFKQERDLQICDNCINLFDSDKLWKLHDLNKLDALDFNENKSLREKFRKQGIALQIIKLNKEKKQK